MTLVTANNLPDAIRGKLKLWFVEPKPNVFVSGINDSLANKVIDFLFANCTEDSGLMIFQSTNIPPWYEIRFIGNSPTRKIYKPSGLQLIEEKSGNED